MWFVSSLKLLTSGLDIIEMETYLFFHWIQWIFQGCKVLCLCSVLAGVIALSIVFARDLQKPTDGALILPHM